MFVIICSQSSKWSECSSTCGKGTQRQLHIGDSACTPSFRMCYHRNCGKSDELKLNFNTDIEVSILLAPDHKVHGPIYNTMNFEFSDYTRAWRTTGKYGLFLPYFTEADYSTFSMVTGCSAIIILTILGMFILFTDIITFVTRHRNSTRSSSW